VFNFACDKAMAKAAPVGVVGVFELQLAVNNLASTGRLLGIAQGPHHDAWWCHQSSAQSMRLLAFDLVQAI